MSLTLAQASTIVDAALAKARATGSAPLTVAVLDSGGHLVALKREDRSGILRPDIAIAKAWGALGMGFGTRELAERAFAASPATAQIDDTLGWILLAQGEADKAMTYLIAANSAAPRNPDIQYHLAVALHRVGRPGDALSMLESLLESGVSFTDKAEAEKLLQKLKPG